MSCLTFCTCSIDGNQNTNEDEELQILTEICNEEWELPPESTDLVSKVIEDRLANPAATGPSSSQVVPGSSTFQQPDKCQRSKPVIPSTSSNVHKLPSSLLYGDNIPGHASSFHATSPSIHGLQASADLTNMAHSPVIPIQSILLYPSRHLSRHCTRKSSDIQKLPSNISTGPSRQEKSKDSIVEQERKLLVNEHVLEERTTPIASYILPAVSDYKSDRRNESTTTNSDDSFYSAKSLRESPDGQDVR